MLHFTVFGESFILEGNLWRLGICHSSHIENKKSQKNLVSGNYVVNKSLLQNILVVICNSGSDFKATLVVVISQELVVFFRRYFVVDISNIVSEPSEFVCMYVYQR